MHTRKLAAMTALGLASVAGAQVASPPASTPPDATSPAAAAATPDIRSFRVANMPLIAGPLDLTQASDPIWIKGPKPAANTIAKLTLRAVESVVVDADVGQGAGKPIVLSMTLLGEEGREATAAALRGDKVYCGAGVGTGLGTGAGRILCLADRDGDRRFEAKLAGLGEVGNDPAQVAIVGAPEPLPAPVAYRAARADEVPAYPVVYSNCAKDHDRPRFNFMTAGDGPAINLEDLLRGGGGDPRSTQLISEMMSRMMAGRGAACQAADGMPATDPGYPAGLAKGSVVAQLGELVIAVAPKEQGAGVRLVRMTDAQALYRLNGAGVVPLSAMPTSKQNALGVTQKFNRPVIMTAGNVVVNEGVRKAGDTVLTTGFAHGYTGVLTRETTIRTLLSKRSLPAGTLVYGVPMSSSTVMTVNGIPRGPTTRGPTTADNVRLVWCVPVQEAEPVARPGARPAKPTTPGARWSATCLPTQGGERHTILKGQSPAFEVSSLRYDAGTSTNEGPAPVQENAAVVGPNAFGGPLTYRFRIAELTDSMIRVDQDTMVGDTAVFTRVHTIPRTGGEESGMSFAGGMIVFSGAGTDGVTVTRRLPFATGREVELRSGIVRKDAAVAAVPTPGT